MFRHKSLIETAKVEETPQRHVRVPGTLGLIEVEILADEKRNVVFHPHIQDIADGCDDQVVRILVVGMINGIVEVQ